MSSRLPRAYVAFAHLSLATAFAVVALSPRSFVGFFYHPKMVAVVHLVTLGWITASILGFLYVIAPLALAAELEVGRVDWAAFWLFAVGTSGMAVHFWLDEPVGMAWATPLVVVALLGVAGRVLPALRRARIQGGVELHFALGFVNVVLAGGLGVALGIHKAEPFLPGFVLDTVFAHAHLAALGWATMIVFGAAYRMVPMVLPAAMAKGWSVGVSAVLLEIGTLGLVAGFLAGGRGLGVAAAAAVAGLVAFLAHVGWMLAHRRPPARNFPRGPDPGVAHVLQAFLWALAAAGLGAWLAVAPRSPESLRLVPVYAVAGLLGFLSAMVFGMAHRFLPLLLYLEHSTATGGRPADVSPYALVRRDVRWAGLACWSLGTPLLAGGLWAERAGLVAGAAWLLLAAVGTSAFNAGRAFLRSRPGRAGGAAEPGSTAG